MDWYAIFKALHVLCAVGWAGGGLALVVLGIRAERSGDGAGLVQVLRDGLYVVPRVLLPSSLGAVVSGVVMLFLGQNWADTWILVGIAGFLLTFSYGNFFIKPLGDRMAAMADRDGPTPAVVVQCRDMLAFIKFDAVMLLTVVADMVLKPHADDWVTLLVMGLVAIGAGVIFLAPLRNRTTAPA